MARIVEAYAASPYQEVIFMVRNAALGRRILQLAKRHPPTRLSPLRCNVRVVAWPGLEGDERERLQGALAAS